MSDSNKQPDWADLLAAQWMDTIKNNISKDANNIQKDHINKIPKPIIGEINFDQPDYLLRKILLENNWQFSAAKTSDDNILLNNLLLDGNSNLKSWNNFKYDAINICNIIEIDYNLLQKDYNTIVASAQMSRLWFEIQRDKAIFPFVKFLVVQDDHTSKICSSLHNLIFSVDDPVLACYFPPNHDGCRTTVKKLRYAVPSRDYTLPEISEKFKYNIPQIVNKIFGDTFLNPKNTNFK
ncbi:hypothetical protein [Empedobacter falsenii]